MGVSTLKRAQPSTNTPTNQTFGESDIGRLKSKLSEVTK
jgi:hypothetical protein